MATRRLRPRELTADGDSLKDQRSALVAHHLPGLSQDSRILGADRHQTPPDLRHRVEQIAIDVDAFRATGDELGWMSRLGKETGRPVAFACLQNPVDPDQWKRLLEAVDEDAASGGCLTPQVAQRPAGLLLGFESSFHPFLLSPAYAPYAMMDRDERIAKLRDPEVKAAILASEPDLANLPGPVGMIAGAFQMMFPLGDPPDYEPGPDKSIAAIAEREGRNPREVAWDTMMARDGKGMIYLPLLGYANGDLEAIRTMMLHPRALFSLSDGGAHCGLICDASMPTFLLTHWVRDRERGERIPIEMIVESQTRRTAAFYGMEDRGVLAPGMKADVNVIDFEGLHLHAPEMVYDLPAEGRRLIQRIDGYRYTVCSGEVTYEDGQPTGALPGKLVRGPQASPAA